MTKILLILGLATTLSFAAAFEKELKSKHDVVVMQSQKPLVVGNNTMEVHVSKGASVKFKAFMPAMPGMPYMEDVSMLKEVRPGVYEGVVNFSMGGTWQIHIFVEPKEGKKYRVKSSVNL